MCLYLSPPFGCLHPCARWPSRGASTHVCACLCPSDTGSLASPRHTLPPADDHSTSCCLSPWPLARRRLRCTIWSLGGVFISTWHEDDPCFVIFLGTLGSSPPRVQGFRTRLLLCGFVPLVPLMMADAFSFCLCLTLILGWEIFLHWKMYFK